MEKLRIVASWILIGLCIGLILCGIYVHLNSTKIKAYISYHSGVIQDDVTYDGTYLPA